MPNLSNAMRSRRVEYTIIRMALFVIVLMNCGSFGRAQMRKSTPDLPPHHPSQSSSSYPLPTSYLPHHQTLPTTFSWGNTDGNGTSYLTPSLNQHLPQWCGSCWAHAALSSLADRIKIARHVSSTSTTKGPDIQLSIQFVLNCGGVAGSCHGGSAPRAFHFIQQTGYVPYTTCQPYIACSSESTEGFCANVDTTCSPINTCRTCTNPDNGGRCREINPFPNATISEYGIYRSPNTTTIQTELYTRGPVTAGIAGAHLHDYNGGIITYQGHEDWIDLHPTHEVSIVGWGSSTSSSGSSGSGTNTATNNTTQTIRFWIVRNSWGEYWGELSFFRLEMGYNLLGIESEVSWAVPGSFTTMEDNVRCHEDGSNCDGGDGGGGGGDESAKLLDSSSVRLVQRFWDDPSINGVPFGRLVLF